MRHISVVIALALEGISLLGAPSAHCQSPFRLESGREIAILSSGVVAGGGALLAQSRIEGLSVAEITALSPENVNAFDRGAIWNESERANQVSDILAYGLIVSPLAMLLDHEVRCDWETYAIMYSETMLLTGTTVQLAKGLVARTRPYAYNPDVPLERKEEVDARKSFYSSHTAFAFASAVFLSTTYAEYFPGSRWQGWIWAISLAGASTVGYLRYAAGEHFPTDVLVGAVLGAATGYIVPALHKAGQNKISIRPGAGMGVACLNVTVSF